MIDIIGIDTDLKLFDTQTPRAANIFSVQVGSLEYEPDLGIDLKYFLSEDFQFQNESFRSYLIQVLANEGINVASVMETINNLYQQYTFNLSGEDQSGTGLVAR